jgi:hypothetical protein
MDHSTKWGLVPTLLSLLTAFINRVYDDVATRIVPVATSFIPVAHHLPCIGVELWMCGESWRLHLPIEVVAADCFEGYGIHGEWWTIFLYGEEDATPKDNVCI